MTSPTRTVLDLTAEASDRELEQVVAEAFALRLSDRARLVPAIRAHPRRRGIPRLRALLASDGAPARTRSVAGEALLALLRDARLPDPIVNARLGRWQVDFLWPRERLVVEVDGYAAHSSPSAFERDHAKTLELQARAMESSGSAGISYAAGHARRWP